jgi:hypothetical protein
MLPPDFLPKNGDDSILGSSTQDLENEELKHNSTVIQNISYTHFTELIKITDIDLDIFVSKYQLQLPDKAKLEAFINNELKNTK